MGSRAPTHRGTPTASAAASQPPCCRFNPHSVSASNTRPWRSPRFPPSRLVRHLPSSRRSSMLVGARGQVSHNPKQDLSFPPTPESGQPPGWAGAACRLRRHRAPNACGRDACCRSARRQASHLGHLRGLCCRLGVVGQNTALRHGLLHHRPDLLRIGPRTAVLLLAGRDGRGTGPRHVRWNGGARWRQHLSAWGRTPRPTAPSPPVAGVRPGSG